MIDSASRLRWQPLLVHSMRVLLFALTIGLIHLQFDRTTAEQSVAVHTDIQLLQQFLPAADSLKPTGTDDPGWIVLDATGAPVGRVLQTSPGSDHVVGFSGPTNTQIVLTADGTIAAIEIVSSQDTDEHVQQILEDGSFLQSFVGCRQEEIGQHAIDAVSGATLTSRAIQEAVIVTLGGRRMSLRFPDPLSVDQVRVIFSRAATITEDRHDPGVWIVADNDRRKLGTVVRSSPFSDNVIGYQGPTDTLICLDPDGRVVGINPAASYDNDPYVGWVREDDYFRNLFNDSLMENLATLDPEEQQLEGVSGATMTSMAVTRGLITAAQQRQQEPPAETQPMTTTSWLLRDLGTAVVVLCGAVIAFTSIRGNRLIQVTFQLILIVYLGLINGDLISQAMLVGWARAGVPWERAGGLVLLSMAAFCIPLTTGRNVYCTHLCPHGAVQQLIKNRSPWRIRLPRRLSQVLRALPVLLLAWCVVVAMTSLPFSLVDIEPFDAWLIGIAGGATVMIAIVGLIASLFVPMAYCRFGCPTGTLLGYLRIHGRSGRWSRRDWVALGLVGLAAGIFALA